MISTTYIVRISWVDIKNKSRTSEFKINVQVKHGKKSKTNLTSYLPLFLQPLLETRIDAYNRTHVSDPIHEYNFIQCEML